ncbi:hypothetical protein Q5425_07580 [Amycolatopsis sp. A133]|nr:hypothetical protein [Amycolatopsis sp. A133]MDQ7803586.1 hypothetical protein [Amycolatopsis sp. A133]
MSTKVRRGGTTGPLKAVPPGFFVPSWHRTGTEVAWKSDPVCRSRS